MIYINSKVLLNEGVLPRERAFNKYFDASAGQQLLQRSLYFLDLVGFNDIPHLIVSEILDGQTAFHA